VILKLHGFHLRQRADFIEQTVRLLLETNVNDTAPQQPDQIFRRIQRNDLPMTSATTVSSYEEACAQHRWEVPARYNIAADICDRHPPGKLAMVHEHSKLSRGCQSSSLQIRVGSIA